MKSLKSLSMTELLDILQNLINKSLIEPETEMQMDYTFKMAAGTDKDRSISNMRSKFSKRQKNPSNNSILLKSVSNTSMPNLLLSKQRYPQLEA